MKKLIYIGVLLVLTTMAACTGNKDKSKQDETRIVLKDSIDSQGVQRMQPSKMEQTITFKGKDYQSLVNRVPNDSLARVKNDMGDVFVDNTITLRLTRGNEIIFNKSFTKHSFSSLISADFMKRAILEGMVFDKTTTQGFVYAVSVSYPQTDLYIPISVTITPDGKMSMVKEELMEDIYVEDN